MMNVFESDAAYRVDDEAAARAGDALRIVITTDAGDPAARERARELAERSGYAYRRGPLRETTDFDLVLACGSDALELRRPGDKAGRGVRVDFTPLVRPQQRLTWKQPLGKAIGRGAQHVVDATAGLGGDSMLIATLGVTVTALERHPAVALLLEDGLRRARADDGLRQLAERVHVRCGDAIEMLRAIDPPPDVVYLDPMFPPKRKLSALPRKEIVLLQELVGHDQADADAGELLRIAREVAAQRVVVKRPSHAPPLAEDVHHALRTKLVRYEVYMPERGATQRSASERATP